MSVCMCECVCVCLCVHTHISCDSKLSSFCQFPHQCGRSTLEAKTGMFYGLAKELAWGRLERFSFTSAPLFVGAKMEQQTRDPQ